MSETQTELNVAFDVMLGKYGNQPRRFPALREAGYDAQRIQDVVNKYWYVADRIIDGEFGNEPARTPALERQGYNAKFAQKVANMKLGC